MTNKKKKVSLLLLLLVLCVTLTYPTVKAKFVKRTTFSFSAVTKELPFESVAYNYTGSIETYPMPKDGYYAIQLWGADGGNSSKGYTGGKGDYFTVIRHFTKSETISIAVGGKGKNGSGSTGGSGGYNGGGAGGNAGFLGTNSGGGGGGATTVYIGTTTTLENRVLIAGGGGGAGSGVTANNVNTAGGSISNSPFVTVPDGKYSNVGLYRLGLAGVGEGGIAGGNFSGLGGSYAAGGASVAGTIDISLSSGSAGTEGVGGKAGNWGGGGGGGLYGGGGASTVNSVSGGGGGGTSYITIKSTTDIPDVVSAKLPTNQDFPNKAYSSGNGYLIISYIGETLP